MSVSSLQIYRGAWVIPVTAPVLSDGAVVTDGIHIIDVASYEEISNKYPSVPVCSFDGVLLPALVNAHIHLDLSVLGTVYPQSADDSMCDWIQALMKRRSDGAFSNEEIGQAAEETIRKQYLSGVGLMLDTGNIPLQNLNSYGIEIISLHEVLGPSQAAQQAVINSIKSLPSDEVVTGHAPYSTGPDLLTLIKQRSEDQQALFSLHLAENRDERKLLTDGEGCFAAFLENLGAMDDTFPLQAIDGRGVVGYLQDLKVLNERTLCVHCVHLTNEEITTLAGSEAHVCLCPGSNRFLNVGSPPIEQMLAAGISPALGTDSIASNQILDVWSEMSIVSNEYSGVESKDILAMATVNGASALGKKMQYGSLEKGGSAHFLGVRSASLNQAETGTGVLDILVSSGIPDEVHWSKNLLQVTS